MNWYPPWIKIAGHNQKVRRLIELDERISDALFRPAVVSGYLSDSDMRWAHETCSDKTEQFLASLLLLSEFYQDKNAILSAALWGIWNSVTYLRRQRSMLPILFERKKKNELFFIHCRGLVTTAAIHFSGGQAKTAITSNAIEDLAAYEANVAKTVNNLASFLNYGA